MAEGRERTVRNLLILEGGFALFFTAFIIIVISGSVHGSHLLESDDFTGTDGNPPDPGMWRVYNRDTNDYVRLEDNTLRVHTVNGGTSYAISINEFDVQNFSVLVDWRMETQTGRLADFRVLSNSSGTPQPWMGLYYDGDYHGWGYENRYLGSWTFTSTYDINAVVGEWYAFNMTCTHNSFNITVVRKSTSATIYQRNDLPIDPFIGLATIGIGAFTSQDVMQPRCNYDNYSFYDNDKRPNIGPIWLSEPQLYAVEDIPIAHDFSQNVSNPDGPLDKLTIVSLSQYITDISGLVVTFEFPNGITHATVTLLLSDGLIQALMDVNLTIQPVNDPPEHTITQTHEAVEDVPYKVNVTSWVSDIDNSTLDLFLFAYDVYVTADGLDFTATFPEGVVHHTATIHLSDGLLDTSIDLVFTISPVDDPPEIYPLPMFLAIEDQVSIFNPTPYLYDSDTPVAELSVICNSTNVTVHGQELHFFYTVGEVTETVLVQLSDGRSLVDANLFVTVEERNDAPIVHPMALQIFIVEELRTIDLSPFVEDEETPIQDLTITFDSPDVFDIEGMSVTFQFRTPSSNQSIYFNVSDGFLVAEGRIQVRVESAPAPSGDERNMLLPVLVIGIIMITSIALLATVEISKVALIGLLLPLYMKLSSIDILDQFTRGKIYGYILANPGVHYNSIKRTLDIPNGSFVYHLNLLQNEGYIKFQHDGIYKRYYPSDMKIPKQEFSLNESQTLIMKIVSRSPGISQKKIASIMGVSSAAVHFQVEELINLGFIRKERRGMSVGYFIQLSG